jgi:hypothetical protein
MHERVEVDVEVEAAPEALHDRHGAAPAVGDALTSGATPQEGSVPAKIKNRYERARDLWGEQPEGALEESLRACRVCVEEIVRAISTAAAVSLPGKNLANKIDRLHRRGWLEARLKQIAHEIRELAQSRRARRRAAHRLGCHAQRKLPLPRGRHHRLDPPGGTHRPCIPAPVSADRARGRSRMGFVLRLGRWRARWTRSTVIARPVKETHRTRFSQARSSPRH